VVALPAVEACDPIDEKTVDLEKRFNKCQRLLENERYDAALRLLVDLTEKCPSVLQYRAVHAYALGQVRHQAGDPKDAESYFRRCLAIDPFYQPARDALAKLKESTPSLWSRLFNR
jgi:hypothetical protein